MKTITTIYLNDDIFKENLRYPIDAPFREFYEELTEKYVLNYNLDSIFFENNIARTGEYFFQFTYSEKDNIITIYNSPNELGYDINRSYIPMLYSMISGNKIDWEDARKKVIFSKNKNANNFTEVLLLFGRDTLKSLEFSWLATFELDKDHDLILHEVINQIRRQEPEIVNFTQGVLFTELEDVIVKFLETRKQFVHTQELIKDHKHTLKNFGFKGALNALYHKIKDDDDLLKIYNYIENLDLLKDYATDILYNFNNSTDSLLLKKDGLCTYTGIIDLIHSTTVNQRTSRIEYDSKVIKHSLNLIDDEDLCNVFTILLNLYSNSRNHGKEFFSIQANIIDNTYLNIIFCNRGVMSDSFVQYFLDSTISEQQSEDKEGITFIKTSLAELTHIKRGCETTDDSTIISLLINSKL